MAHIDDEDILPEEDQDESPKEPSDEELDLIDDDYEELNFDRNVD